MRKKKKEEHVNISDYKSFIDNYNNESDKGSAILAASFLEAHLEEFIKRHIVNDKITNSIFDGYGLLSTFSAKIDCAYAFRLFPKKIRDDIFYIKQIRNQFAHTTRNLKFTDSSIIDCCKNLTASIITDISSRDIYLIAVCVNSSYLQNSIIDDKKSDKKKNRGTHT